jgi:hypothetical protein
MGAFDMLSDDDPRVLAHEEAKLRKKYSTQLSDYTLKELENEIKNRKIETKEAKKKAKFWENERKHLEKAQKELRYKQYLELKKEFEK